ncbi:E3 ubiquitin-protein ligase RNF128a precursor [Danio rerio]|uniref:E3 ubiquitin-protein ligase RNF128a precursor n=1 Tax=Danio rerio TaxID=7955 RepID=Q6NX00_DANRE|nr:E3 ubiquitin-protein ligase RNF128a precursor [Danio rerio]AAH67341.1 Ring finger protein 128 [Danio rerio]|eukprot:NP_997780.1 E3 ubiquitin-protein ligase RNF128 precursor [Danio rerio]
MGPLASRDVFSWLLLASVLQVSSVRLAEASYLCTAYLNISYTNPENNRSTWFQEEMGLYGQDSPKAYVKGNVYLASPTYGCDDDTFYGRPNGSKGWIALIQRGNGCTFTEKINIAAMNGAAAAIIFNDFGSENRVIQMSHPGTTIVAIMIGNYRGMELVQLLDQGVPVAIAIEVGKQHGPWMSHYSVFFVSISFFIVTAATVGYFIFYSARRLNSLRQQNRSQKKLKAEAKKAIGQLQVRTLRQGDQEIGPDADACAVCIDSYKAGDVLSILTCNHFFHKSCIEPWLLEHRTCPMCKCDILKALGVELDVEEQPQISVPDFRPFSTSEDLHSETASHTHSETASSGYASMHGNEHLAPPEGTHNGVQEEPHYDNLAFESDVHNQSEVRT